MWCVKRENIYCTSFKLHVESFFWSPKSLKIKLHYSVLKISNCSTWAHWPGYALEGNLRSKKEKIKKRAWLLSFRAKLNSHKLNTEPSNSWSCLRNTIGYAAAHHSLHSATPWCPRATILSFVSMMYWARSRMERCSRKKLRGEGEFCFSGCWGKEKDLDVHLSIRVK